MRIAPIQPDEVARFDELAAQHGSVFHHSAWTGQLPGLQRLGIYEEGGELIGGTCVSLRRRLGLSTCMNGPFSPNCGPFLLVKAQHPVAVLETKREAMEALCAWLRRERHAMVLLKFAPTATDFVPFWHAGFHVTPAYTYVLDLGVSEAQLLANMASARRRNIQRAAKDGMVVRQVTDLRPVKQLATGTFARQGKAVEEAALHGILFRFATPENSFAFVAYSGESAVACCFVVRDRDTAYYLIGGYSEQDKHGGAGAMAMWAAIQHAKALGLQRFDFEGSMIPAIERYFRGFGGQLEHYFTVSRAWLPLEMLLKLRSRSLF